MNQGAFASIVEETKGVVLKAIRKSLFSEYYYAIDDVVQETYIRAYRSLVKNKFKEESKLSSWLYTIARNESIRMNKKLKSGERRREKYVERNIEYLNSCEINNIEGKIEKDDLLNKLSEAVKNLPDKYGNVIDLYVKGFNEKEIAKFLSISRGTVKSRIHRGKEKLREILKKEEIYA
ncbi:RNA polymerase sigma factor [candidate division WOR-3 bacterium]|nr:RNA polymerase sigma factor [candidate division WOR-3 bacterium]